MKKRVCVILSLLAIVLFVSPPIVWASTYRLPTAWQIVYINRDGTIDVYDYRVYIFNDGPPSDTMPYKLKKSFPLYGRTLTYPYLLAYAFDRDISGIVKPVDIREKFSSLSQYRKSLKVSGKDGDFKIQVPNEKHLYILVHYKVKNITAIGKDFARTYYALPLIGTSEVYTHFYGAVVLPRKVSCHEGIPVYDEGDKTCPCFKVIRFLPKGGPIGTYYKGCDFILFDVSNMPVNKPQELDAIYPKDIISSSVYKKLSVDETYADVVKWQKEQASQHKPNETTTQAKETLRPMLLTWTFISPFLGVLFFAGIIFVDISRGRYINRYLRYVIEWAKADMNMPSEDVFRSLFFTEGDMRWAISGNNPYDVPEAIEKCKTDWGIRHWTYKGSCAFRGVFFSLMVKGYIEPIVEGKHVKGFHISRSSLSLTDAERYVLEYVSEIAGDDILSIKEFKDALSEGERRTLAGGITIHVPHFVDVTLHTLALIRKGQSLPPVWGDVPHDLRKKIERNMRKQYILVQVGKGMFWAGAIYFLEFILYPLLSWLGGLLVFIPFLPAIFYAYKGYKMPVEINIKWVSRQWLDEFMAWLGVKKWIYAFTRIAKKDITAYEGLVWDKYYLFATLWGIEKVLLKALKTSGLIKRKSTVSDMYALYSAHHYISTTTIDKVSGSFTSSYVSEYHRAHASGTSSGGGTSGSSYGGGSGGGGGTTGW